MERRFTRKIYIKQTKRNLAEWGRSMTGRDHRPRRLLLCLSLSRRNRRPILHVRPQTDRRRSNVR